MVWRPHHEDVKWRFLTMKNEVKHTAHSSYRCEYHIVFAPKYRRKVIYKQLRRGITSNHILLKVPGWVFRIWARVLTEHCLLQMDGISTVSPHKVAFVGVYRKPGRRFTSFYGRMHPGSFVHDWGLAQASSLPNDFQCFCCQEGRLMWIQG